MEQYHKLLKHIVKNGLKKGDRTGTGTKSIFGYQMRFDLNEGFPMVTTKKLHLKSIVHELLWFLKGDTNIKYLNDNGVHIWDEWADENGNLGEIYGKQWRNYNGDGIDQIKELIETIKTNPNSRRLLVSAWNPSVLPDTSKSFSDNVADGKAVLPPCHAFFQFNCRKINTRRRVNLAIELGHEFTPGMKSSSEWKVIVDDLKIPEYWLDCQLYQRSADVFLGVPFNIASYALFTMMVAQVCNMIPGEFIHTFGDVHIYNNHFEQVELQLSRDCRPLPKMIINPEVKNIFDFKFEDFDLVEYNPHPHIKGDVSI